jgi:hypothetical protein
MMKVTMVIPSYWRRKTGDSWRKTDSVYDHPTPLDEEGTLERILKSLSILRNKDFTLVVLGVATASDIQKEVEKKIASIIKESSPAVDTLLFSYSQLERVHLHLRHNGLEKFMPLLKLDGYSNIRNLCLFVPHLLGSEVAVLIDDDEIFEDPRFMDKALEFIGKNKDQEAIMAVAGYYINPDDDVLLHKEISPWMTYWNKIDCMNRAFKKIIAKEPRLKETPFAFGGNLVLHRDLFTVVPFDPAVPRGEDIDFLINARLFGHKIFLDNKLSIKHAAPPKTYPLWRQAREDIFRFLFEKGKLQAQKASSPLVMISAEDLDPYPGEFLKDDLEERIFRSNLMLAVEYIQEEDKEGALECMRNISLAKSEALPRDDPIDNLLHLQGMWEKMMDYFADRNKSQEVLKLIGF